MQRLALLTLLALASAGTAQARNDEVAEADAPPPGDVARAEYIRLSQKAASLATKNAWSGVERTYQDMLETGQPLSFDDHLLGASAARAIGDVTSARERLLACNEIKEERRVLEWLYDIDMNYGKVSLKADVGAASLEPAKMPFDPTAAKAVQFAVEKVQETGVFEGYLPEGEYTFGRYDVRVRPQVSGERIDMRTQDNPLPVSKPPRSKRRR